MSISVYVEGVRCFVKPTEVELRKLNLLVGENSSGKTTFMAMVANSLGNGTGFPGRTDFSVSPYNMGGFESIASHSNSRNGVKPGFKIGFRVGSSDIKAEFINQDSTPWCKSVHLQLAEASVSLERDFDGRIIGKLVFPQDGSGELKHLKLEESKDHQPHATLQMLFDYGFDFPISIFVDQKERNSTQLRKYQDEMSKLLKRRMSVSIAPIRARPRRTYDEPIKHDSPEGEGIPTLLATALESKSNLRSHKAIKEILKSFGRESGLFSDISASRLGKGSHSPFQLLATVGGKKINLASVGYGVSQVLPIVVRSTVIREEIHLLVQQPEVHLHPRAQAALGSFFSRLVPQREGLTFIETHSDYLVDRVRQEVAKGVLSPEDVQILFFHKPKAETIIHSINIDEFGNIEDAPPHYRDFFMQEAMNLL